MKHLALIVAALAVAMPAAYGGTVWEWDCSGAPDDFIVRGGGVFDEGNLSGDGLWYGGQTLDTRPKNYLLNPLTVDLTWQSLGSGDWDAVFWLNAEFTETSMAVMYMSLTNDQSSQTLTLRNVQDPSWTTVVLATITDLPLGFIDTHLYVDTAANTISITVDDELKGVYDYVEKSSPHTDMFATILGGNMELDYIKVVPEPTTMVLLGAGLLGLVGIRRRKK